MEPMLLRVPEAARLLGVSKAKGYEMAASGQIPTVRLGRSVRVPVEALKGWIAKQIVKPT